MNAIYRFLTGTGSTVRYSVHVHSGAVGKGGRAGLSPTVRELCDEMLHRMDTCYEAGLASSWRDTPGLTAVSAG
jgi:hypothetical protein